MIEEREIVEYDEPVFEQEGKKWLKVKITNNALSQINKIVLGDKVDPDNKKQVVLRNQVHEDCLRLFKQFN